MLPLLRYNFIGLLLIAIIFSACRKAEVPQITYVEQEIPEIPLVLPEDQSDSLYRDLRRPSSVAAFYRAMAQRPGWVENERSYALGDSLVDFIRNVRYYGLLPQDYHFGELAAEDRLWWRPEALLRRDVLLTDAFISLASDLRFGRLAVHGDDSIGGNLLFEVLAEGGLKKALEAQQPDIIQYRELRNGLERFILNADSLVRAMLMNGITADSLLIHRKLMTIELNLERWRWENDPWGDRYIYANIPSFMLDVVDHGKVVLESRTIVGKPEKATPEFSSMVQCFVTYPYWHVPRKISVEEFLPAIQRDTSFLIRNNFDVLDRRGNVLHPDSLDWQSFNKNNFPVVLRQREGRENSLGILKFVFDNPYAVYVHDTNAPRLFRLKMRALSHGCIRLERAGALAHYLATGEVGKKSALIDSYLDQKLRHTVDLPSPIPIHIRYFTAATDKNGKVVFFEDIYEKDQVLIERLYGINTVLSKGNVEEK